MIPRGQGMMMAHITIQGGIVKIAILEMNIETEGVTECKMYLQLHIMSFIRSKKSFGISSTNASQFQVDVLHASLGCLVG